MPSVRIKRGTRAQISSAAAANGLKQGELYHVTDENRVELGTGVNSSIALATKSEVDGKEPTISAGTTAQYWRGDKTWQTLNKSAVGLGNVDNTSDANKPISTATQSALNAKAPLLQPTLTGLREVRVAMAANNIDVATGNLFTKTISGATTLTVSNVPATGTVATFILKLTNGGSATVNWFSGVKWPGGTAPTLTASGRDTLYFETDDGGTTWDGSFLKDIK